MHRPVLAIATLDRGREGNSCMSGHRSERFNPCENEEVGNREDLQAEDPDDGRFLTPPFSLLGGDAGQNPDAVEERAAGLDTDPSSADRHRDEDT